MVPSDESKLSIRRYLGNVMGGSVLLGVALASYASWLLLDLEQKQNMVGRDSLQLLELESALEQADILLTSADLAIGSGETYTAALAIDLSLDLRLKFSDLSKMLPVQYGPDFEKLEAQLESIHSQLSRSSELSGSGRAESLLDEFDSASLALTVTLSDLYIPYQAEVLKDAEAVSNFETRVKRRLVSVFLVYVLLNLMIILWSLRKIALPIEVLTRDAERSITRDQAFQPSTVGPTEIAKMADFFSRLTDSLNQKVRERTLTLENRTLELEKEIDIRRKTESELKRAKEVAERSAHVKSEFLSVMSHELRTPLNVVVSCLEVLRKDSASAHQLKFVNLAQESGKALTKLINAVLETSKIESGKLELDSSEFNLESEFEKAVLMTKQEAYKRGLDLFSFLDPNLPQKIIGDDLRWRQVAINLIDNAIKYTESGWVKITLKADPSSSNRCLLTVQDSGPGIEPELGQTIFDGFTQADSSLSRMHSGVGLGLKICREIAIAMHGECDYTSKVGSGSKFWFSIPSIVPEDSCSVMESLALGFTRKPVVFVLRDENDEPLHWLLRLLEAYEFEHEVTESEEALRQSLEKHNGVDFAVVAVTDTPPVIPTELELALTSTSGATPLIHLRKCFDDFEESRSVNAVEPWRRFDPSAPLGLLRAILTGGETGIEAYGGESHAPRLNRRATADSAHLAVLLSSDGEMTLIVEDYFRQAGYNVENFPILELLAQGEKVCEADLIVLLVPKAMDEGRLRKLVATIRGVNVSVGLIVVSHFKVEKFVPEQYDMDRIRVCDPLPSKTRLLEIAGELTVSS